MKVGIFYEHQLPKPWDDGIELKLFQDALEQVELADKLGIDYAWEVEHHFLEEYSHSSAPEIFLAAASQRTKNIRYARAYRRAEMSPFSVLAHSLVCSPGSPGRMDAGESAGHTLHSHRLRSDQSSHREP